MEYFKFEPQDTFWSLLIGEQYIKIIVRSQMEKEKGYQVNKKRKNELN